MLFYASDCSNFFVTVFGEIAGSSGQKNKDQYVSIRDISRSSPNAKVAGILTSLSPMKKSKANFNCSYLEGEIADEELSIRLLGFDSGVRRKLEEVDKDTSTALTNSEIKKRQFEEQMEFLTKNTAVEKLTQCQKMPIKLAIDVIKFGKLVTVADI